MADPNSPFWPEDDNWPEDESTRPPKFELWLEFEHWLPDGSDPEDLFFNMVIRLQDGRRYALNVWTYKYFQHAHSEDRASGENLGGKYLPAPDLFVEKADRKLLEEVVADMIQYPHL